MYYYSKATGGFYCNEIHGQNIPIDSISISDTEYTDFYNALNSGKGIDFDANGGLCIVDVFRDITSDDNSATASQKLAMTDWAVNADVTDSTLRVFLANKDEYVQYRLFLRTLIANKVSGQIQWPDSPKAIWIIQE